MFQKDTNTLLTNTYDNLLKNVITTYHFSNRLVTSPSFVKITNNKIRSHL